MSNNDTSKNPGQEVALAAQVAPSTEIQSFVTSQVSNDDLVTVRMVIENQSLEESLVRQMKAFHAAEKAKSAAMGAKQDELDRAPLGDLEAKAQAVIDALAALQIRCTASFTRSNIREVDGTYKASVSFSLKSAESDIVLPMPDSLKAAIAELKIREQAEKDAANQVQATRSKLQNSSKRRETARAKLTVATLLRTAGGKELIDAMTRDIDKDLSRMVTPAHLEDGGLDPIVVDVPKPSSE